MDSNNIFSNIGGSNNRGWPPARAELLNQSAIQIPFYEVGVTAPGPGPTGRRSQMDMRIECSADDCLCGLLNANVR